MSEPLILPFAETPVLDLATSASEIDIVALEKGGTPRLETRHDAQDLGIDLHQVDGAVVLRFGPAQAGWRWFMKGHHAGMTLFVPKNIRARIRNDMGSVRIVGLEGCDLDVSTSAGSLKLDQVRGRLKLNADAGEIRGDHLGGSIEAECNAGSVRLGIEHLDAGKHFVRSNMGSVRVDLASGLRVRIEAVTVMGSTRVKFPSTPDAEAQLKLSADLGSVKVNDGGAWNDDRHGDWADWRKYWADEGWPQHFGPEGQAGNPFHGNPFERWAETARNMARTVFQPPAAPVRDEELRRILSMVESGKINAADAEKLIRAIEGR
jgi:hypothetical protein